MWGENVAQAVERVAAARGTGDPTQIQQAVAQVSSLVKAVGGLKGDLTALFDGKRAGRGLEEPDFTPRADKTDYLAVEKKTDFVDSLSSPDTAKVLATQKSYAAFLRSKGVPDQAMPGMLAMYQVLSGPPTASSREMEHLLPTLYRSPKPTR